MFNSPGRGYIDPVASYIDVLGIAGLLDMASARLHAEGVLWETLPATANIYQQTMQSGINWTTFTNQFSTTFANAGVTLQPGNAGQIIGGAAGQKLITIYGRATHDDTEFVANSGYLGSNKNPLFIEDQPALEGSGGMLPVFTNATAAMLQGDFGNTHSLVLLVDSLSIMKLLTSLDASLEFSHLNAILAAASNQRARGVAALSESKASEGDSLEQVLDALRKLFTSAAYQASPETPYLRGAASATTAGQTQGFGNVENRTRFHERVAQVEAAIGSGTFGVVSLVTSNYGSATHLAGRNWGSTPGTQTTNVFEIQVDQAKLAAATQDSALGVATRYALREGLPFAVTGFDYSADESLKLYHPVTAQRGMTGQYIADRTEFLTRKLKINGLNENNDSANPVNPAFEQSIEERAYGFSSFVFESRSTTAESYRISQAGSPDSKAQVVFGTTRGEVLRGSDAAAPSGHTFADRLFGDGGNDYLVGRKGNDYLEGGAGTDVYEYSSGDGSDTIVDIDGKSVVRYSWRDGGNVERGFIIGDGSVRVSDTQWTSADSTLVYTKVAGHAAGRFDLSINLAGLPGNSGGGTLTIRDFDFAAAQSAAYLGIRLHAGVAEPTFSAAIQIRGGQVPAGAQADANGNMPTVTDTLTHDHANSLYGTTAVDDIEGGGGDDWIRPHLNPTNPSAAGDWLKGGTGSDWIVAWGGDDRIDTGGGRGEQSTWNATGAGDLADGGEGNDRIFGDSLVSLVAAITEGEGAGGALAGRGDALSGGAGDDLLVGTNARDLLSGGAGKDTLVGGRGDDWIFSDVDMILFQGERDWTVASAAGTWDFASNEISEAIRSALGTSMPSVYSGPNRRNHETVTAAEVPDHDLGGAADIVYAGAGNDLVWAGRGDDFIDAGSGNDTVVASGDADVVNGGEGDDWILGDYADAAQVLQGGDILDGGAGNDHLFGLGGDDIVFGGSGNDWLEGNQGDDILIGGDGVDTIYGGSGGDTIIAGTGANETLYGGSGKDTYVFTRGDGVKTIEDPDDIDGTFSAQTANLNADKSIIILNGVSRGDIKFRKGSLLLDLQQGDAIHLVGFVPGANNDPSNYKLFDRIEFGDGSVMTFDDMRAKGYDLDGTTGNDTIYGTTIKDHIAGLGGNDTLHGFDGDDSLDGEDGNDTLWGGNGADTLSGGDGIDVLYAAAGDDQLLGGAGSDNLQGEVGNDALEGGAGDDGLSGGDGNDILAGGDGADGLDGGAGDDALAGGAGADTYYLRRGMGRDSIDEVAGSQHTLWLVADGGNALLLSDLVARRSGDDLVLDLKNTQDGVLLRGAYALAGGLNAWRVIDSAGTIALLDQLTDTPAMVPRYASVAEAATDFELRYRKFQNDSLLLSGHTLGVDGVYSKVYGANTFRITLATATEPVNDAAQFAQATAPWSAATWNGNVASQTWSVAKVTGGASGNAISVQGGAIADGGAGNNSIAAEVPTGETTVYGGRPGSFLGGGDGDDLLTGNEGRDVLTGGSGVNRLAGGAGNDRYLAFGGGIDTIFDDGAETAGAAASDQDSIDLPAAVRFSDLAFSWSTDWQELARATGISGALPGLHSSVPKQRVASAVLTVSWGAVAGGGSVRIVMPQSDLPAASGIELLRLGDGTILDRAALLQAAGATNLNPNNLDNTGSGDNLSGEGGNDTLSGNGVLRGGAGNDSLNGGTGNDVLAGDAGADNLHGGAGHDLLGVGRGEWEGPGNTYRGGTGNDLLLGSKAADLFLFERGDGADIIGDWLHDPSYFNGDYFTYWWEVAGYTYSDTLRLGAGIAPHEASAQLGSAAGVYGSYYAHSSAYLNWNAFVAASSGPELLLSFGGGDSVRFVNWVDEPLLPATYNGEQWIHPNASTSRAPHPLTRIEFADGTVWTRDTLRLATSAAIVGGEANDSLSAVPAGSMLRGLAGNDSLSGAAGADYLEGGLGNDISWGLAGNDTLSGGAGNDVLNGGADADHMAGGEGDDAYVVDNVGDVVLEAGGGGNDYVDAHVNYTISPNVETLIVYAGATGYGDGRDNVFQGQWDSAANTLVGADGDDFYIVGSNDVVVEATNGGAWDAIHAMGSYTIAANVEGLTVFNGGVATGNGANNNLVGALDPGANRLIGLGGDDYYLVGGNDEVEEASGGGTNDVIEAHASFSMPEHVEVMTMRNGTTGTGNAGVNRIHGDQDVAANVLIGLGGDDMYHVGVGDTVIEAASGGWDHIYTIHDRTIEAEVEGLSVVANGANVTGDARVNYLTGHLDSASNALTGLAGNDVYEVGANDLVVEAADGGAWDHINAYGNYVIPDHVEALRVFNGASATGNAAGNHLQGFADAGANLLTGYGGSDLYLVGRGGGVDTVVEAPADAGYDTVEVYSGVAKNQLWFQREGDDLEALVLGTTDKAVVRNWFADSTRPVEQFMTTDGGHTSVAAQVDLLVQAMAGINPSGAATNHAEVNMNQTQRENLNAVFATAWT